MLIILANSILAATYPKFLATILSYLLILPGKIHIRAGGMSVSPLQIEIRVDTKRKLKEFDPFCVSRKGFFAYCFADANADVHIRNGLVNYPVITSNVTCRNIIASKGAVINVNTRVTIHVTGN